MENKRSSIHADLLKARAEHSGVEFRYIMQADFLLFIRAAIEGNNWWPVTLLYAGRNYGGAFELFARAQSKIYFDKIKHLIGIQQLNDLLPLFDAFKSDKRRLPRWDFEVLRPASLIGLEALATKS